MRVCGYGNTQLAVARAVTTVGRLQRARQPAAYAAG